MNPDRMTTTAQQTLATAQADAVSRGNPEVGGLHVLAALLGRRGGWRGAARVAVVCLFALPASAVVEGFYGFVTGTENPIDVATDGRWIGVLGAAALVVITAPAWAAVGAAGLWLRTRLRAARG